MKKLLSLLVLAGVFFFNTGQLNAQDDTSNEIAQEEDMQEEAVMDEEPTVEEAPEPKAAPASAPLPC